ncbi:polyhydroxyalkanoate synthesis repressor PhaR [Sphingorhabdus sp. Alg239-R122]|uniref:polyhydroxyalkanoate synthesis repressor PhaR n=1 Tax=Sphingorhabdus sp. Alg239-R122 TaxID=2305989 RepID=UPI0013DBE5BF|nr:polyhydroxyalkanoate synthesis repressor PhaR [Sphingorhabdus sp. Alg239-R122]
MSDSQSASDDAIIIKKYANRRLYNTQSSSYITLDYLAKMTRDGTDFKVVDAKTGADITHNILTQIIMEEESSGQQMLPVSFLRELISMYGNSMQSMIPQYLEASMESFRANQEKFQKAVKGSLAANPFTKLAEQNMAMMRGAADVLIPGSSKRRGDKSEDADKQEIADLKAQLAEMQKKMDALTKDK